MERMKKIQGGKGPRPMGEGGGNGLGWEWQQNLSRGLHIFLDFRFRLVSK
jgi:hypothetical protein